MPPVFETLAGSEPESFIAVHKKEMTGIDLIPVTPTFDIEPKKTTGIDLIPDVAAFDIKRK